MEIFEMESSKSGNYFLAAEFEKKVAVYESVTSRKLGEYNTHFTSGGKRMCITDSGKYFAAAAYGRFGITLFDIEKQNALWTTKEIKRIQQISFSADDNKLFAINNDDKLYTISLTDGSVISVEKNIRNIFPDSTLKVKLASDEHHLTWDGGSANLTGKILRLCSGNNKVFCSIMGGGLKCFSVEGSELWYTKNRLEEHYIKLCYCPKFDFIIGLGFKFGSERIEPFYFLDVYSAASGDIAYSVGLNDAFRYTFIDNGEKIVSGTGNVYILQKDSYTVSEKQFDI